MYAHVNKINGKVYIGRTNVSLKARSGRDGKSYHHSTHFKNAIEKYGWDNFEHIVLIDGLSKDLADIFEEGLIEKYNTMNPENGYNMLSGGKNKTRRQEVTDKIAEKNRNPSEETLKRMSIASLGRKHSPETIEKIRNSNLGKKRSEEARKKMSIAKQNMSDETKKKIGDASKGRKPSDKCIEMARNRVVGNRYRAKPIAQYDLEGKFIRSWECAIDAEKELGFLHTGIASCCNGKARSCYGFQWRYYFGDDGDIEKIPKRANEIPIYQYTTNGDFVKKWNYITEIENTCGFHKSNIDKCCKGKINTAYGYVWSREERGLN